VLLSGITPSAPVLEILKGEPLALRQRPELMPKNRLGPASDYTHALWDRLTLFLQHGEIEIEPFGGNTIQIIALPACLGIVKS
jgi:hypothetical protein